MVAKGSIAGRRHLAVPELVPLASSVDSPAISTNKIITTIGSKSGVDVRLPSKHISGAHALLINVDNNVFVCDLISRTGVFVNDKRVRVARLLFGDMVRFGNYRYRFSDEGVLRKSANALEHGRSALLEGPTESATIDNVAFIIGRRAGAGLVIESKLVSSAHAIVVRTPQKWLICDLHSRTGTTVNGRQIQITSIRSGDSIRIGNSDLIFTEQDFDASADSSLYGASVVTSPAESIDTDDDLVEEEVELTPAVGKEIFDAELADEPPAIEPVVAKAAEAPADVPAVVGLDEPLKQTISALLFKSPQEQAPVAAAAVAEESAHVDEAPSPIEEEPSPTAEVPAPAIEAQAPTVESPAIEAPIAIAEMPSPAAERPAIPAARPQATKSNQPLARRDDRPRRPARPDRPKTPTANNGERHKWGPLATAVADPRLLELVAVSRRRQMPTHRLAPVRPAAQKLLTSSDNEAASAAPRRRRRLALAGAVAAAIAIVSGAAWYVISHPNLVAQLW